MVDMIPRQNADQLLACHLFQSARDVPLIPDKPAAARVYASWEKQADVHKDYQVKTIGAKVLLKDWNHNLLAYERHTLVRPDLWDDFGIDKSKAEHTAQITGFVPTEDLNRGLRAEVEVWTGEFEGQKSVYRALCPLEI